MTLEQAERIYLEQIHVIAKPLPLVYWLGNDWRARARFLFAEETLNKKAVNSAMRQFAATGQWPALRVGSETFLACCRLMCAAGLAQLLTSGTPPVKLCETTDCALHEWFLLEAWNQSMWQEHLKLQALSSLDGGANLYSKPPE